ncbi:MAG: hypothetical protein Q9163_005845, partial [Psora crenata]
MKVSQCLLVLALVSTGLAAPTAMFPWSGVQKGWPSNTNTMSDADILNYLLTIEHIQDAFYRQGIQNSSRYEFENAGFPDPFFNNLTEVSAGESARVQKLQDTLVDIGAPVSAACTYTWPSIEGATAFVALADIIAGTFPHGVSPHQT